MLITIDPYLEGVHEIIFATALSRRLTHADPYARFQAVMPFASQNALFKDYGDSQTHVGPGARVGFMGGAEMVPYDDPKRGVKFFIDMALGHPLTFECGEACPPCAQKGREGGRERV